jgi:hypothetical protein
MYDALYFPIHRAKKGEIMGAGHLSPTTLTRVRPTFEVQKLGEDSDVPLEEYLAGVALDLSEAWDHRFPLFVDFPRFAPGDQTQDGKHCVEFFFRCLRQHAMLAIPMTGSESVRGPGYPYLEAVAAIAQADGRGAAIRLAFDEFNDNAKLQSALEDTLRVVRQEPESVDLFLDLETIAFLPQQYRSAAGLVSLLLEPLRYVANTGFRNIVICGSCIPENVDKRYDGRAMRVERTDLLAWQILVEMFGDVLIKRGDSGVIFPLEQDVIGPVRPPARIRLSTAGEYVLWRAPRKDYLSLAEQVAASGDLDAGLDAWATTILLQCARFGRGKGGPTEWVARDTNLSTEVTVHAMESFLRRVGRLSGVSFADPEAFPWNQTLIDSGSPSPRA